jgi:hypothetical protein
MSLPTSVVIASDVATNPFTIPGTTRTYSTTVGTAITVPGEDSPLLQGQGWLSLDGTTAGPYLGAFTTGARPTITQTKGQIGTMILDTTLNYVLFWGGPTSKWVHAVSGATNQ